MRLRFRCASDGEGSRPSDKPDGQPIPTYAANLVPSAHDMPAGMSGRIELRGMTERVFEPGKEYFIDVTPAT